MSASAMNLDWPLTLPKIQSEWGRKTSSRQRSSRVPLRPAVAICWMSMCGTGSVEVEGGLGGPSYWVISRVTEA